jgi:hypothetical protein
VKIQPIVWALAIVLTGLLTLGVAASVQAQGTQTEQPQPPAQQTEIDPNQIKTFASAAREIQEIRARWAPKMREAGDAEKAKALQTQANAEMVSAVEKEGLTVEMYNTIAAEAQKDPQLAAQIAKLMEQ